MCKTFLIATIAAVAVAKTANFEGGVAAKLAGLNQQQE